MCKYFKDSIYDDYLSFSLEELKLIDNSVFKRLRYIKQLGILDEVFPTATHTRYIHSLGVANLGEKFIKILYNNSDINLNNYHLNNIKNIKIAGLYHDIGHGPFSHVFDNLVLNKLCPNSPYKNHEYRSCKIFNNNINSFNYKNLNGYDIDSIINMINPKNNIETYYNQIIANKINSIDIDKFDYLLRDCYNLGYNSNFNYQRLFNRTKIIDNKIYFYENTVDDIFDMYYTRYKLHREIYNHKTVKCIELMIGDILLKSNKFFDYPSIIQNNEFINLNDTILDRISNSSDKLLNKCKILIERINKRDLYKEIFRTNSHTLSEVKDIIYDKYPDQKSKNFHFNTMNFNLCNGNKNPLNNINFYKNDKDKINYNNIVSRKLIPDYFNETLITVCTR